jgi:AraC-like DNA-binding protein
LRTRLSLGSTLKKDGQHSNGLDAASAAHEVGHESASQFNREYQRILGQLPMRDIKARQLAGVLGAAV